MLIPLIIYLCLYFKLNFKEGDIKKKKKYSESIVSTYMADTYLGLTRTLARMQSHCPAAGERLAY